MNNDTPQPAEPQPQGRNVTEEQFLGIITEMAARTFRQARKDAYAHPDWIRYAAGEVAKQCVDLMRQIGAAEIEREIRADTATAESKNPEEAKV